ncbi:Outer membrane protein TolC [Nitrosomonas sp. PY1]|uniref:TolC family protein n=1 Tax=Nitrosomonas sp. PY1 TaxID=1803906 RepID=UPI001FC8898B|nr:TolC family protein [Nitrosomonas sp. PY1]GKS69903.1 Outer membrane protein TolC [Nitrosomonas sp. PY1]
MKKLILLWLLLALLASNVAAQVRLLNDFSSKLDQAAIVLKAQADLEAQQSNLLAQEAQRGWEVFGGISAGYQKSPFAREPFGRFFDPMARIGLRYPLLGSAERQQRAVNDAATQVKIEDIRLGWSRRLAASFLEESYAAYWSSQKMLALSEAYIRLRDEGFEKAISKRREAGLLFMSDYLEFLSAFDRAERTRIEYRNNREQALNRLSHLTNSTVMPFEAVKPLLAEITNNFTADYDQPDLRIIRTQIDNLQNTQETEKWQGIESDVSTTAFVGPAIPYPSADSMQYGYGGAVGVNFRMPLEIVNYRKSERSRLNSQLISFRSEYARREQELQHEFHTLFNNYQQTIQQIKFLHTRLAAAKELMRERDLRMRVMDGDVLEKYLQAVNTYYRVATEYIEAESEHWKIHIRLRQYISESLPAKSNKSKDHDAEVDIVSLIEPLNQAKRFLHGEKKNAEVQQFSGFVLPVSTPSVDVKFATYVWNFEDLVDRPYFWQQKSIEKIDRFLISLNAKQILRFSANPGKLNQFIEKAHRHGSRVELLLGDPSWILPKYRNKLMTIIGSLADIRFDGLHLDIEPDQLEDALTEKERLIAFVETVRQATAISPWPVGVSMHHRYLHNKLSFDLCIVCKLKQAGIREIAIMYYSINTSAIVKTLRDAMNKHPSMFFSLAQSLEPVLGPENSYFRQSPAVFNEAMQQFNTQLQNHNFSGIVIQSWQDFESYLYENSI